MNNLNKAIELVDDQVVYSDSDGLPMADNTLQFQWIVTIKEGLEALFRDRPDVFVAGDLLWYPVQGNPTIRRAPDALVVFGRPKEYRGSYVQHREDGIAPQVTFEVRSPNNTRNEMEHKRQFYETYGVEEYYLYDPDHGTLEGWVRRDDQLQRIDSIRGWVSPRLDVTFDLDGNDLILTDPNGRRLVSYQELDEERIQAQRLAEQERQRAERSDALAEQQYQRAEREYLRAEQQAIRAEQQAIRAEQEALRAEQEAIRAEQEAQKAMQEALRAEQETQRAEQEAQKAMQETQRAELAEQRSAQDALRAEQAEQRAKALAERLRALGIDPDET